MVSLVNGRVSPLTPVCSRQCPAFEVSEACLHSVGAARPVVGLGPKAPPYNAQNTRHPSIPTMYTTTMTETRTFLDTPATAMTFKPVQTSLHSLTQPLNEATKEGKSNTHLSLINFISSRAERNPWLRIASS